MSRYTARLLVVFAIWSCSVLVLSSCASSAPAQSSAATLTSTVIATPTVRTTAGTATASGAAVPKSQQQILLHPAAASQRVQVQVPSSLRSGVFSNSRYLNVPPGFQISLYALVPGSRFMAVTPDGNLLVSQPDKGSVVLVRSSSNGAVRTSTFVSGLSRPHDIVFHKIGATTYVYISETDAVVRYVYHNGDTQAKQQQVVVANLPDSSLPELNGAYNHELKNIALDSNNKLYVSIGSTCNVCLSDTESNPVRGAIYQYNADGTQGHLFARGLRNAEGLDFVPGTNDLWVAVNNRDDIAYPFQDATGQYQKVISSYVDNHPPDEFTHVVRGANYGWPFCNPNPDKGLNSMPFDRDVQFNADGHVNCGSMTRIDKGIQAHSAPLGLTFLQDSSAQNRTGALVALHGSWDRTTRTGFKLIYFPWNTQSQQPGQQIDLVTGWMTNTSDYPWGRPVDAAVDQQGNILISDDTNGAIYRLSYTG